MFYHLYNYKAKLAKYKQCNIIQFLQIKVEQNSMRKYLLQSVITMVNNTKLEKTSLREMAATTVPALLMVESTVGKNTAERALVSCHDSVTLYNFTFLYYSFV